jgi:uncharacterized membrane protein
MRFDRILGAVASVAGLALLALMAYGTQKTLQQPNNDYMASLTYPYIGVGLLLLVVGLYFLGRPTEKPNQTH